MKKNIFSKFIQIISTFLLFLCLSVLKTNTSKEHTVEMTSHRFVPDNLVIKKGDSVKFINKSNNLHNVVIQVLKVRTKLIKKNQFLIVKFEKNGIMNYYCQPHRAMGMKGVIRVE